MKKFLVLVAAVCMAYTTAFAQTVKPFKEGDRADPLPEYAYSCIQWRYWW